MVAIHKDRIGNSGNGIFLIWHWKKTFACIRYKIKGLNIISQFVLFELLGGLFTVHSNHYSIDSELRKELNKRLDHNMNQILLITFSVTLVLSLGFSANLIIANAQSNSTQNDMKSVTYNINKSLEKLTGGNSSDLLDNTMASINKTASELANQGKDIVNEDSLNTATIIAKKIGIGIADVLSNISGEVKQGILSK